MPVNHQHYLGVRGTQFEAAFDQMESIKTDDLNNIAANGRAWALGNYSPKPTALRLVSWLH